MPINPDSSATLAAVALHAHGVPKRTIGRAFGWNGATVTRKLRPDSAASRLQESTGYGPFFDAHVKPHHIEAVNAVNPQYGQFDPVTRVWSRPCNTL